MQPPTPRKEKFPEPKEAKEQFLEVLEDLCANVEGVAKRREMLQLIPDLFDKVAAGGIMDAIVQTTGTMSSITDIASDSIAIVFNNGWSLGFEGTGGELVILIEYIDSIKPRKTGLEINLESGETIYLRFHGKVAPE